MPQSVVAYYPHNAALRHLTSPKRTSSHSEQVPIEFDGTPGDRMEQERNFYVAAMLDKWTTNNLDKALGGVEEAKRFEKITVPEGLYLLPKPKNKLFHNIV